MKHPEKNLNVHYYACHALTMLVTNHTYFTNVLLRLIHAQNMSSGTRRRNDKALTSMRHHYVALTPLIGNESKAIPATKGTLNYSLRCHAAISLCYILFEPLTQTLYLLVRIKTPALGY